ncbi:hypothetical protein [Vibrio coralliilyticus]|uniref:hypothetical protein n=1 Tax=Vibrio coralliilyticus TaxID=190893 RepID=UPI0006CDCE66|nr:hypothetical protein [Vibrio coralliilyticus]AXN32284.1 hypothetical protein DVV14_13825 [Vibrio coralliilyticus]KPH26194.1 hypothetical protein ADU60_13425 [Vibrio coralliilyticus]
MSGFFPRRAESSKDALAEILENLAPAQAESMSLIQHLMNNQVQMGSMVVALARHQATEWVNNNDK